MRMIICSSVKIIATHTHAHRNTQKKIYSAKSLSIATFARHRDSNIQETTSNLPRGACIIICTHILTITNTTTYNNTQISSTHTHTHTHKQQQQQQQRVVHKPNILLTVFFDFSNIFLSLPDDCRK